MSSTDSNWIRYSQLAASSERIQDYERYQGDLYLHDDWKKAEFILPDQSKILVDSVKLNLLRGQVEIHAEGKHLGIRGSQYDQFTFLDDIERAISYKSKHYFFVDGVRLPGIVKSMEVGDYGVIVAYDSGVRQVSRENALMIESLKKDIVRVTKLRFIEKDGALTRIKSKKDLHRFFNNSKEIKNYIKKNKLSHKEEADIAQVLLHFQSNG